jgi:hypothetical protein
LRPSSSPGLYLALIHHPVLNKRGETIASAITNLDLHDIARAGRTFGARGFFVVTPLRDQQVLTRRILGHWIEGDGAAYNPSRGRALSLIRVVDRLADARADIEAREGRPARLAVTSARDGENTLSCEALRAQMDEGTPVLLALGTAWGLAPECMAMADCRLRPIRGAGTYNHLSVRSAAAILLDRLLGERDTSACPGMETNSETGDRNDHRNERVRSRGNHEDA